MAQNPIKYKLVVIGGSAGSLDAVLKIIISLTPNQNTAFVIIIHRRNEADSILKTLLESRTSMPVREVEDKEPITPDTIYLAPPDYHLLIEDEDNFSLDGSEKIQYSRPSINVTFESVAEVFGANAIGILLSGANADGAAGLKKIKDAGGYTIVQDPFTAEVAYMPLQAVKLNAFTSIAAAEKIAELLERLLN